jgi:hypothetical protein
LNALFLIGENVQQPQQTQFFLEAFLKKMIEELPVEERALYAEGEERDLSKTTTTSARHPRTAPPTAPC